MILLRIPNPLPLLLLPYLRLIHKVLEKREIAPAGGGGGLESNEQRKGIHPMGGKEGGGKRRCHAQRHFVSSEYCHHPLERGEKKKERATKIKRQFRRRNWGRLSIIFLLISHAVCQHFLFTHVQTSSLPYWARLHSVTKLSWYRTYGSLMTMAPVKGP